MATWHRTDQAKIEKWLETANRQKFKTSTPILTLAHIIFHIHGEYNASSFEFVSSRKKCIFTFSETLWLYARQPGKVLSSENSPTTKPK